MSLNIFSNKNSFEKTQNIDNIKISDLSKNKKFVDIYNNKCNENIKSRLNIINDFCNYGKIKKIITEKPLSTSYKNCLNIKKICISHYVIYYLNYINKDNFNFFVKIFYQSAEINI